jgi:hypothetical protein
LLSFLAFSAALSLPADGPDPEDMTTMQIIDELLQNLSEREQQSDERERILSAKEARLLEREAALEMREQNSIERERSLDARESSINVIEHYLRNCAIERWVDRALVVIFAALAAWGWLR